MGPRLESWTSYIHLSIGPELRQMGSSSCLCEIGPWMVRLPWSMTSSCAVMKMGQQRACNCYCCLHKLFCPIWKTSLDQLLSLSLSLFLSLSPLSLTHGCCCLDYIIHVNSELLFPPWMLHWANCLPRATPTELRWSGRESTWAQYGPSLKILYFPKCSTVVPVVTCIVKTLFQPTYVNAIRTLFVM